MVEKGRTLKKKKRAGDKTGKVHREKASPRKKNHPRGKTRCKGEQIIPKPG